MNSNKQSYRPLFFIFIAFLVILSCGSEAGAPGAPAATLASPVPPKIERILFHSDRDGNFDIYTMNAQGGDVINLTNHPARDTGAIWSPDGRRIAFLSTRDGPLGLYVMNADGSSVSLLTTNIYQEPSLEDYTWSPDGRYIAYRADGGSRQDIYIVDVDSGAERNLTDTEAANWSLDWSPDGRWIAFESNRTNRNWGWLDIYAINVEDGQLLNLTNCQGICGVNQFPAWSPVGGRIAFTHNDDLYTANADGSQQVNLTNHPADESYFKWSPDGKSIAFISDRNGSAQLFVMNADGSGQRLLTDLPNCHGFHWSPDSSRLTFVSDQEGNDEIYLINADGSGLTRLTNYSGPDKNPSWQPLGNQSAHPVPTEPPAPVVTESSAAAEDNWIQPDVASPSVISPASRAGILWWLLPVILLLGALLVYFRKPFLTALRNEKETGQEIAGAGLVNSIRDGALRLGNTLACWFKELAKLRWFSLTDCFKRLGKWSWVLLGGLALLSLILFWPKGRHSAPDMPESPALLTEPPIATEPPSPDFSALRDQIAFTYYDGNSGWIYLMNPDGSDRRPLLGGDGLSYSNPIWSPDGTRLAYLRGHDLMVTSGFHGSETATVQLTSEMMVQNPLWSPDGTKIAFVSNNQLFLVDSRTGATRPLVQEGAWTADFTWSPDSARLAVVYQNPSNGRLDLLIVDTNGTVLKTRGGSPTRYHPVWSPLGDSVVYYTVVDGNEQLAQYFIESDSVSVLGGSEGSCGDAHAPSRPALSPDGQFIVYHDCRSAIYVLDMKTLETRNIFLNGNTYQGMDALDDVSLSPDGQWILFRVYDESDMGIYRVRPDGSDLLRLSPEDGFDRQPTWQPLGDQGARPLPAEPPAPVVTESPAADSSAYTLSLNNLSDWRVIAGNWEGADRTLVQFNPDFEGAKFMFVGSTPASPDCFTYRLIAQPREGREGMLIIFPYQGRYVWWNIGGWTNSASRVEYIANSEETYTKDTVIYGSQYMIQVTVRGDTAAGWLNGDSRWQVVRAPEEVEGLPDDGKRGTGLTGFIGVGTWRTAVLFYNIELIPACDALSP